MFYFFVIQPNKKGEAPGDIDEQNKGGRFDRQNRK